jgi:hypothetical protein
MRKKENLTGSMPVRFSERSIGDKKSFLKE